ncbi:MAG: molybdopterin-dependent oxidoreductase [Alphaproteobacteria bacterium]|nr:molybdopterin-dependent oxidoreductase [Alphaproteobacteria bacterium]
MSANESSGIGAWIPRWEDHRLLTGQGRYTDDHNLDGQLHAAFVRSPHAHAKFSNIDTSAARATNGVVAIYTAADLETSNVNVLPSDVAERGPLYPNKDGSSMPSPPYYPLARERVRHVGDPVAVVIAETLEIAAEAAEKIEIEYSVLPVVTDTVAARDEGQPELWPEAPNNTCFDWVAGDEAATDKALAEAKHVASVKVVDNRVVICFLEPRGALAEFDAETQKFTLHIGCQGVHVTRDRLSHTLGVDPENIRVISRDVGGGFGSRSFTYPEYAVVMWAARKLKRPIKWLATRAEEFMTANQGRDYVMRGTLGLNADGDFLALKVSGVCSLGAYLAGSSPFTALRNVTRMLPGIYKTPVVHLNLAGVFTNTVPIASYRGVGRVEAIYTLERLIDEAARQSGFDRVELRRRNAVPPDAMPYTSPVGSTYDSGEYVENMAAALSRATWDDFEKRRKEAARRGRLRGIGICNYIEGAGGVPKEYGSVTIRGDETVLFSAGSVAQGQGHETTFRQIIAEQLGISIDCIEMVESDFELIKTGVGTNASRSIVRAGPALVEASDKAIKAGLSVAAELLEAAPADISFIDGHYLITGTDRSISMFEVARAVDETSSEHSAAGEFGGDSLHDSDDVTYPNGCHVCEVEIDPETGAIEIIAFTVVDDVGRAINPMIVHGQSQGAVAQGIGQALHEHTVYDPETGQLLSGSFLDYTLPRAEDLPFFDSTLNEVLSPTNSLGAKGAGEGGTTGAPAAVINAIIDALAPIGVTQIDMPATPHRIWQAIQDSKS